MTDFLQGLINDGCKLKAIEIENGWLEFDAVKDNETSIAKIKEALEAAVQRQLMSDVPYGVLLSGGLDSSVTSAIAKKDNSSKAWKDIWGSGQGIGSIKDSPSVQSLVNKLTSEFKEAVQKNKFIE